MAEKYNDLALLYFSLPLGAFNISWNLLSFFQLYLILPSSSKDKASQTPSYKALATNKVILFKKSGRFIVL
jgi:hypothetical protein